MQSPVFISVGAITYVVILIAISVFASRRVRNSADFIVAGRQLPLGLCVFTVFATWFGSGTLIGAAGAAYTGGLRAVVANPFGSALYLTIAMIPVLIGIAGTIVMPDLVDSVFVLPEMGKAYLPPLGMALFAGAMFSALMSSADGGMLAPASIFAQNILKTLKSGINEANVLRATRYSVVVFGVLGLCTALFFQNVYQLMVKSFSILMVGLFVPMTAAIYWKKANEAGAVASMVSGLLSWLAFEYWNLTHAVTPVPSELPAAGIGLIVLVIVSLPTSRSHPPKPATDINGEAVDIDDRLGILSLPRPTQQRQ